MKTILKQIIILSCLVALLILPFFVFAGNSTLDRLTAVGPSSGYAEADEYSMAQFIGTAITAFLSLLGVIFVVLMIYGGFKWMKASGRSEEVEKAQDIIRQAIIGLVIVVSSWSISAFVMASLLE